MMANAFLRTFWLKEPGSLETDAVHRFRIRHLMIKRQNLHLSGHRRIAGDWTLHETYMSCVLAACLATSAAEDG